MGFGDIAPLSDYGKVTIMVMITASMILIPTQVSKLSTMLANRSAFDGEYKDRGKSHVLVCGDPPAHSLVYFLHEFFNASSKMTSERVVIMGRNEPRCARRRASRRSYHSSRRRELANIYGTFLCATNKLFAARANLDLKSQR